MIRMLADDVTSGSGCKDAGDKAGGQGKTSECEGVTRGAKAGQQVVRDGADDEDGGGVSNEASASGVGQADAQMEHAAPIDEAGNDVEIKPDTGFDVDGYEDEEDEYDEEDDLDYEDEYDEDDCSYDEDEIDDDDEVSGFVIQGGLGMDDRSAAAAAAERRRDQVVGSDKEVRVAFEPRRSSSDGGLGTLRVLPRELLLRVLAEAGSMAAVRAAAASSSLFGLAHDEALWRGFSRAVQKGRAASAIDASKGLAASKGQSEASASDDTKEAARVRLHPFFDFSALARAGRIDAADAASILEDRGVSLPHGAPLADLLAALAASTPPDAVHAPCASKWKASFFTAPIDALRTRISLHELTSLNWLYIDSWSHYGYDHDDDDDDHHDDNQDQSRFPVVRFNLQTRTRGPISGTRPRPDPWTLTDEGHLQVARYPRHSIRRTADWGWEIYNAWVVYRSI